jgi:hypothetical protein
MGDVEETDEIEDVDAVDLDADEVAVDDVAESDATTEPSECDAEAAEFAQIRATVTEARSIMSDLVDYIDGYANATDDAFRRETYAMLVRARFDALKALLA